MNKVWYLNDDAIGDDPTLKGPLCDLNLHHLVDRIQRLVKLQQIPIPTSIQPSMDTADGERKVLDNTTPLKKKDLQNPEIVRKVQVCHSTSLARL